MDTLTRAVLEDIILGIVWPAMEVFTADSAQTDFDLLGSWDTAHDTPITWVNGNRQTGTTWVDADTVRLASPTAAGDRVHVLVSPGAGTGYMPRSGAVPLLGDLDCGTYRVRRLAQSQEADDGVRRDEVPALAAAALGATVLHKNGSGWPPTANLNMGGRTFTSLQPADQPDRPVRRDQVPLRDGSQGFSGPVPGQDPTADAHLATLATVKAQVGAAGTYRPIDASLFTASAAALAVGGGTAAQVWTQHLYFSGGETPPELPLADISAGPTTHASSVGQSGLDSEATFYCYETDIMLDGDVGLSARLLAVAEVAADTLAVQMAVRTTATAEQTVETATLAALPIDGTYHALVWCHSSGAPNGSYLYLEASGTSALETIDGRTFRHYTVTWRLRQSSNGQHGYQAAKLGTDHAGYRTGQTPWYQHAGHWRVAT